MGIVEDIEYMKKKIVIIFIILLIISVIVLTTVIGNNKISIKVSNKDIAVYVYSDTDEEYIKVNDIPSGEYTLNTTLSNCLYGSTIESYNSTSGTITTNMTTSDKCTFYFDIEQTNQYDGTDLTGTTWIFNEIISGAADYLFHINFITSELNGCGSNSFDRLYAGEVFGYSMVYIPPGHTDYDGCFICEDSSDWLIEEGRIINITGGDDATDPVLISWIEANATRIP